MAKITDWGGIANSLSNVLTRFGVRDARHFVTPGTVWYVDSSVTDASDTVDGIHGQSWTYPFATIDFAVDQCTANKGDVIMVGPNHTETIANATDLVLDVEDIIILGTSYGNIRPVLTFSASGSTITINKKCYAYGLCMKAAASTTVAALLTVDAAATGTVFAGMTKDTTASSAVITAEIAAGDTSYATFGSSTYGNDVDTIAALIGKPAVDLVTTLGTPAGASLAADIAALKVVADAVLVDTGTTLDTALGTVGTNLTTALSILSGTTGIASFPAAAAAANNVSLAEVLRYVQENGPDKAEAIGTSFWVSKDITSSSIAYETTVDVTGISSGGNLVIEDVILKTDETGLAGGTDLTVLTNNAAGDPVVLQTAISGLGANDTIDLTNASVTKLRTVLETGKKVMLQSTVADCTGDGVVTVWIKFTRVAARATIEAAA